MQVNHNVRIAMRDGVELSALVCRPDGDGPFPCVLTRTCYTKWHPTLTKRMNHWAANGYVLVVQDVRGRGDSDGRFYPLVHEKHDGLDTLDWIAAQPWSDGRVVMTGGSYSGWTQLYLTPENHPALVAVVPMVTPPDPDLSFPVDHGIPVPAAAAWLASLDGHSNQELDHDDVQGAFAHLPLIDFDRHIGRHLQAWRDWIENPPGSAYWRDIAYQGDLHRSQAAMLHVSGWYDDCLIGALQNYQLMAERPEDGMPRAVQGLLIGPWSHSGTGQRSTGAFDFGPDAEIDLLALQRDWFDARLKGKAPTAPPVRLFVMGRNQWITASEWPLAQTEYVPHYLHSGGAANGRLGDGSLSTQPPADEPPDRFDYDPAHPVPYCSDFNWQQVGGPDDFAAVELRPDVLVYTGPVLTEPMLVCGPLKVKLFAASSAPDTDWTAKILDAHPDGRAIRLNDGVVRARYREGAAPRLLEPDAVEEYLIDCWATCIELQPGHRLRLEISSSAFGKGDVNLNTGGPVGRETTAHVAAQAVHHDRLRPSCLILPVVREMP